MSKPALLPKLAILCNPALAGSYYVVAGAALDWIDPGSFMALEAIFLLPAALAVLLWFHREVDISTIIRGLVLGAVLFTNMSISIWSIAFTSVTNAGFYPALIGPLTVLATWLFFGTALAPSHKRAAVLALAGAAALISSGFNVEGNWRGDALALLATVVFVGYVLLLEKVSSDENNAGVLWSAQMTSVSSLAILVYILVGKAPLPLLYSKDALLVGGYSAVFTTMLPVLFATYAQRYLSAIFVSFTYLLEPIWAASLAFLFLGEKMSNLQVIGGTLVLSASFLTWFNDYRKNDETSPIVAEKGS